MAITIRLLGRIKIQAVVFIVLVQMALVSTCSASGRVEQLNGFNWYGVQEQEVKKQDNEQKEKEPANHSASLPEYERNIRNLQQKLQQAHRRALDNPTHENILTEMMIEKEMMDKSNHYGKRRVAVAMMHSEFTDMAGHSNVLHRKVNDQIEAGEDAKKLRALSQDWGLILQVADDCPHCHTFAPIVSGFAKEHGFELLAASKDGSNFVGIEGVRDRGQMVVFNPGRETPVLYLVKSDGKEVIPVARGINATEQIIANIKMIDQHVRKLF